MKNILKLSLLSIVIAPFIVGCGSNAPETTTKDVYASDTQNTNCDKASLLKGVYSGYTQDTNGNKVSLRVFAHNTAIAQVLDFHDAQTVLKASKLTENVVTFKGYNCQQSSANLTCNDVILKPLSLDTITLTTLDGTYKKADSTHNIWTMKISSGNVDISNDANACRLTGRVSVVLDKTVPFFDLTASCCTVNGNSKGYAQLETVSSPNDTLNLLIPNFTSISSNWTK